MFTCLDCGHTFSEPEHYIERHGFDIPPYDEYDACPECGGNYTDALACDCCGEWIVGTYIKINDERYCEECCQTMTLGDED